MTSRDAPVLRTAPRDCHADTEHVKGGFTMRPRTILLFALAALAGAVVAVLPALAVAPSETKLEVNQNCNAPNWPCWTAPGGGPKPAPASRITIAAGGEVTFTDNGEAANIKWTGATMPTCSPSVPVSPAPAKSSWEGKCRFEQPGTYKFESSTLYYPNYEVIVEGAATSTTPTTTSTTTTPTSTTTTTTTTTTTPSELSPGSGSPLEGGPKALKLAGSQRGSTVHGSIKVSRAGSGGRLQVGLFSASASLAKTARSEPVRVGLLLRSSLKAGSVSFAVPLSTKAKASLRRHHRLAVTVKITLTPLHGAAATVARGVVLHS